MRRLIFNAINIFWLMLIFHSVPSQSQSKKVEEYVADLNRYGQEPMTFVKTVMNKYDLVIFDDALHSAYEAFVFYNQLIKLDGLSGKINYVFLEVVSTTAQPALDRYLVSATNDSTLLKKVFQDDYSGYGWRYHTYIELLNTIREKNSSLPEAAKIKVIGVNPPIYWEGIHSANDYDLFQNSLNGRDYSMYLTIVSHMSSFGKGNKGIFLTNSRHAYKGIRDKSNKLFWNTATFFDQWNPGKVYSIRMHNVSLFIQTKLPGAKEPREEVSYRWVKMDDGLWDEAFAKNENKPVAIPFEKTSFGRTPYIGNLMLNSAPGQTMYDAFDATIFLAPVSSLHNSAKFNFIYDLDFKKELERRLRLLEADHFEEFLKDNGVNTFDAYFAQLNKYVPLSKQTLGN